MATPKKPNLVLVAVAVVAVVTILPSVSALPNPEPPAPVVQTVLITGTALGERTEPGAVWPGAGAIAGYVEYNTLTGQVEAVDLQFAGAVGYAHCHDDADPSGTVIAPLPLGDVTAGSASACGASVVFSGIAQGQPNVSASRGAVRFYMTLTLATCTIVE